MDWKKTISSPWFGLIGLLSLVWGIPGMGDDAAEWRNWFGVMNTGWFYLAAGAGAVLLCVWLLIVIGRHWVFLRSNAKVLAMLALLVSMVLFVGGPLYYYVFTYERPKWIWTHPTLSVAEQEKARAECEIAAYEALGGGTGKVMDPTSGHRAEYVSNCLTVKGFTLQRVDEK